MEIRDAVATDAEAIVAIYNHYVLNTEISFEEAAVTGQEMARRIAEVQDGELPWLVLEDNGVLAGYAYATKWRVRHAYRFSVECSVYLAPACARKGYGTAIYTALFERLRSAGRQIAIGGIALPNASSIALHEKMGFEKVAHFQQVGFKFNRWIDVGYWQMNLA